ncbi:MAG: DUF1573 domain-containing protein [Flavobacteriales bacterium]|nr:DUF1573 domain-containing protein [Flavobacteriales bacterium]
MSLRLLFALVLLGISLMTRGQTSAQWTAWGDTATARGDHYGASRMYARALEMEPGRMALQWKLAEACRLSHQFDKAEPLYEQVQRKDMGRSHPEALRWLGEMQLCNGRYDEAKRTWEKVQQREKRKDSLVAERARNAIEGCAMARAWGAGPDSIRITHLPEPVNSYDSEFGARPGPDSTIWFTSLRGEVNDEGEVKEGSDYRAAIYSSRMAGGRWTGPVQAADPVNSTSNNANAAWSTDGDAMFFSRTHSNGMRRINRLDRQSGELATLALAGDVSQPAPFIWNGTSCMLYTRWMEDGGADIRCACPTDEALALTFNTALDATVNTRGRETCPWLDVATQSLWFSSDHLPGLGGYDVFISNWVGAAFTTPRNAGPPLNSPVNDLYPVYEGTQRSGWFTSNRTGSLARKGENCCNDLYRFELPQPAPPPPPKEEPVAIAQKRITSLREKLPVRLYFHNDEPEPRSTATTTAQTYEGTYQAYKARVPEYHKAWEGANEDTDDIDAFFRDQVDQGQMQLAQFVVLLKEAMGEGQRIRLVIRGFASPLAKSDYNVNLSLRRIRSVVNELQELDGGFFIPYLEGTADNGGRLVVEPAPFGESKAIEGVSDVLDDLRGSVYSVAASRERRVEIEQVEVLDAAPVATDHLELGRLIQGDPRSAAFLVRNPGQRPLRLLNVRADCGCTSAVWTTDVIAPGGSTTVTVEFNGRAPEGSLRKTVTLLTDGDPAEITLTITGTVEGRP